MFANEYRGRAIEFDGVTANLSNHEGRKTRFDILIYAGDSSTSNVAGPAFQFRDVGVFDLNPNDPNIGRLLAVDTQFHVVATVVEYNEGSGLFILDPVLITSR